MYKTTQIPLAHPVQEACSRLGIGRVKLYELLKSGQLRGFKIGNKRLIPESELHRIIAERLGQAE